MQVLYALSGVFRSMMVPYDAVCAYTVIMYHPRSAVPRPAAARTRIQSSIST